MIKKKQHYREDRGGTKFVNNISVINPLNKKNDSPTTQDSELMCSNRGRQLNTKKEVSNQKPFTNTTNTTSGNSNYGKSNII